MVFQFRSMWPLNRLECGITFGAQDFRLQMHCRDVQKMPVTKVFNEADEVVALLVTGRVCY